jgi:hypothetical protein
MCADVTLYLFFFIYSIHAMTSSGCYPITFLVTVANLRLAQYSQFIQLTSLNTTMPCKQTISTRESKNLSWAGGNSG